MKRIFLVIFLAVSVLSVRMMPVQALSNTSQEHISLPSSGVMSNLSITKRLISLDLRDIEIKDALKFLATKADINIVPSSEVSGRITLMIKEVPVEDIFEIMIRSNNLAYEKIGSIYNVMTQAEYKKHYGERFNDIRQVKIFHLKYVIPDRAYNIIDAIKSSIGKVLVEGDSGTLMVLDTPEKIKEIGQTLEALERKSSIRIFDLHYAKAKDVANQLKDQLNMKNVGSVKADKRTNQVIVQTLPERMKDIERIIARLDQKTKQVLIDARIIQVKLSDALSKGVEWEGLFNLSTKNGSTTYVGSYPFSSVDTTTADWRSRQEVLNDTGYVGSYPFSGTTSDFSSGTKRVGTEQMHVGVVGRNDYDLLIKYLKTLGDVKILSNPKLVVTNNQEARIHVGERQAYITNTTTAGQTTTTVSEEVTFMDVGLQLFITPTINDEGYITLNIKPDISTVVGTVLTSQNNEIPIVDTSTAETTVMIKDGATVVVGGLRREEKTFNSRHIPILGSIPLLGTFFKSENKETTRSELLIMVTGHIIEGDELTTGYAGDLGYKTDKAYQDYNLMTHESDLSAYEKEKERVKHKNYQQYPKFKVEEEFQPTIKPLRDG